MHKPVWQRDTITPKGVIRERLYPPGERYVQARTLLRAADLEPSDVDDGDDVDVANVYGDGINGSWKRVWVPPTMLIERVSLTRTSFAISAMPLTQTSSSDDAQVDGNIPWLSHLTDARLMTICLGTAVQPVLRGSIDAFSAFWLSSFEVWVAYSAVAKPVLITSLGEIRFVMQTQRWSL